MYRIMVDVFLQVVRLRQELVMVQTRELAEVQRVYEEETRKFFAIWEGRIVVRKVLQFSPLRQSAYFDWAMQPVIAISCKQL